MDKVFEDLEELTNATYRIAMYLVFFTLGLQLACYFIEKHRHELKPPEALFIMNNPCSECEEKRKEREGQHHGRSEQDS